MHILPTYYSPLCGCTSWWHFLIHVSILGFFGQKEFQPMDAYDNRRKHKKCVSCGVCLEDLEVQIDLKWWRDAILLAKISNVASKTHDQFTSSQKLLNKGAWVKSFQPSVRTLVVIPYIFLHPSYFFRLSEVGWKRWQDQVKLWGSVEQRCPTVWATPDQHSDKENLVRNSSHISRIWDRQTYRVRTRATVLWMTMK